MKNTLRAALAFGLVLSPACSPARADTAGRRIALVIGISSYEKLPAELTKETPRADAAKVAAMLEQGGGFDRVRLLTDASATRANIEAVLKEQVAKEVGPDDLFLFYFVGHGMGADIGDPRLLTYDADPDALDTSSFAVKQFAGQLQTWVPASRYVVITDAAFDGQVNGLALLGPTGNDWPSMGAHSFVMSSAAPRQTAGTGVFARAFVEGMGGRADANSDLVITGSELNNWLVVSVPEATGGKQFPTVQGAYDPSIDVAKRRPIVVDAPKAPVVHIPKAKFVFPAGAAPKVACQEAPATLCDPSCYVWDVIAGPCQVTMRVEGAPISGAVDVLYAGAYTCGAYMGQVQCSSPPPPSGP